MNPKDKKNDKVDFIVIKQEIIHYYTLVYGSEKRDLILILLYKQNVLRLYS